METSHSSLEGSTIDEGGLRWRKDGVGKRSQEDGIGVGDLDGR